MTDTKTDGPAGLDYNDRCNLAFGRIRRFIRSHPDVDILGMTLDGLLHAGLLVGDLDLPRRQVALFFREAKAEALASHEIGLANAEKAVLDGR